MTLVSFVAAAAGSGKTTLIEKIVVVLKARGVRVAVVKHAASGFTIDMPGKDSARFAQAGADSVVLAGPGRIALLRNVAREPALDELAALAGEVDIVLCEGFKGAKRSRIEVFRSGVSGERPLCMDDDGYLALVSDRSFVVDIPCFNLNDAVGVAGFIQKHHDLT